MSTVIGIDLGTSTTEAAVIQDGVPVMLLDMEQQAIIPSAVGVDANGEYVVGEKARAQYLVEPENTAIEIKRKIGSGEKICLGKKEYTPVKLSSILLEYVRDYASDFLDEDITRAVISVPAYFDELQRRDTMEAGEQAGFEVERIINEPTAAALSYGLGHMEEESHVLVYDLGGGTFDVTLLEMFDGVLEVKASSGDNQLGGKDFDQCLIDWMAKEFQAKHGVNLKKDTYAMVKLKEKAEWCKKELSNSPSCHVTIPFIVEANGEPLSLDETISVDEFEELIAPLLERTHHPIDVVIADSGVLPSEIDHILLVGGSTRVPMVQRDIASYLGKEPSVAVNPDYAVAEGTAIQAGMIEGAISREDGLIMTDVNPYTLGVRSFDGFTTDRMTVVIPRNVTIPVTRKEMFYTSVDGQVTAEIEVYQGESGIASSNHFLGKFKIHGIPPRMAGEEKIEVAFSYDLNGMLAVQATVVSTHTNASIEINMMEAGKGAASQVNVSNWKDAPGASAFRSLIRRAERMLKKHEIDPCLHANLEETVYMLKRALIEEDTETAEMIEDEMLYIMGE